MQGKTGGDASGRVTDGQKNSAFNMELRALFPFIWSLFAGENIADGLAGADILGGVGHGRVSGVIAAEDVATVFKGNALDDVLVIGEAGKANQRDLAGFGWGVDGGNDDVTAVDAGFHAVAAGADDAEAGGIGVFAGNKGRFVRGGNGVEGQARSGGTENVAGWGSGGAISPLWSASTTWRRACHARSSRRAKARKTDFAKSLEPCMTRSTMSSVVSEASMGPFPSNNHSYLICS